MINYDLTVVFSSIFEVAKEFGPIATAFVAIIVILSLITGIWKNVHDIRNDDSEDPDSSEKSIEEEVIENFSENLKGSNDPSSIEVEETFKAAIYGSKGVAKFSKEKVTTMNFEEDDESN